MRGGSDRGNTIQTDGSRSCTLSMRAQHQLATARQYDMGCNAVRPLRIATYVHPRHAVAISMRPKRHAMMLSLSILFPKI